jgi:hypothetical protein
MADAVPAFGLGPAPRIPALLALLALFIRAAVTKMPAAVAANKRTAHFFSLANAPFGIGNT